MTISWDDANLFRKLTPDEEKDFRQWAHENYDQTVTPSPLWHPVVRDEWSKITDEKK